MKEQEDTWKTAAPAARSQVFPALLTCFLHVSRFPSSLGFESKASGFARQYWNQIWMRTCDCENNTAFDLYVLMTRPTFVLLHFEVFGHPTGVESVLRRSSLCEIKPSKRASIDENRSIRSRESIATAGHIDGQITPVVLHRSTFGRPNLTKFDTLFGFELYIVQPAIWGPFT